MTSHAKQVLLREEVVLEQPLPPAGLLPPPNGTGADLVAYWEREGLIGTRPDIEDSLEHARAIRSQAERRVHECRLGTRFAGFSRAAFVSSLGLN